MIGTNGITFYSIGIPLVKNKIFCNSIKMELPNMNAGELYKYQSNNNF